MIAFSRFAPTNQAEPGTVFIHTEPQCQSSMGIIVKTGRSSMNANNRSHQMMFVRGYGHLHAEYRSYPKVLKRAGRHENIAMIHLLCMKRKSF